MDFKEKTRIEVSTTAEERATFAKCAEMIRTFLARLPEGSHMEDNTGINRDEDLSNMAYMLDYLANVEPVHFWECGDMKRTFPFAICGVLNVEAENRDEAITQVETWSDDHPELDIVRWDFHD